LAGIITTEAGDGQISANRRLHRRDHSSRAGVYWADRLARAVITVGGIGTIIVVLLVVLVLLANVVPLFRPSHLTDGPLVALASSKDASQELATNSTATNSTVLAFGSDEYSEILWLVRPDQSIDVYSLSDGTHLQRITPPARLDGTMAVGARVAKIDDLQSSVLLGLEDGSVRPILWTIDVSFASVVDLDREMADAILAQAGAPVVRDQTIFRATSEGLIRKVKFVGAEYLDPIPVHAAPIEKVDWVLKSDSSMMASSQKGTWASSTADELAMGQYERQAGGLGAKPKQSAQVWRSKLVGVRAPGSSLDADPPAAAEGLMISGLGDSIQSVDKTGRVSRWSPGENQVLDRDDNYMTITAQLSALSASEPLLGRATLMLGNQAGEIEAVALTTSDSGRELRTIHRIPCSNASIRAIAASPAHRLVVVADKVGGLKVVHVTSERIIAELDSTKLSDDDQMRFTRTGRELLICNRSGFRRLALDSEYPEASLASFFKPLWYEGYQEPGYVWQSSTGSNEGEPKFSLIPLVFGTLKATFYSMLIAAPIAILAAIFGSEFLSNSWRAKFKPLIELMASVPSVVLGFIGAMVLAPIMRDSLFWVLFSVATTLFLFLLAANLWILIPTERSIPWRKFRLPLMFLIPPTAILLAAWISSPIERWVFGSTMQAWLSDPQQSSWPGWFLLMMLPSALVVVWLFSGPMVGMLEWLADRTGFQGRAVWQTILFLVACVSVILLACATASLCTGLDWDARRGLLGAYQERNALLVGGILGFAIIPLIYTLADDALQSVPQHLRSASLGCGATVWQTTMRVVVPTAMSGLFSALMIGFGRAIGETMVVLMAAGNTPLMDWNPFNGYRTLSATLATELPEASRGSTHYHTLFLAALLLFLFTLVANTLAEWVRLRFRKRAYQL
jgi:phosphate transport system permease protein